VAKYLVERNLSPGQIHVDGYAAVAANDIDSGILSRERALFVINELQKRGVPERLFTDPVAFGSVDIWGSSVDENERSQNRRVRIFLDGDLLTSGKLGALGPGSMGTAGVNYTDRLNSMLLWLLFLPLLALIAAILFMVFVSIKKSASYTVVNLEDDIRRRAYELYLKRNGQDGDANKDWWEAVPEICALYESAGYEAYPAEESWWARRNSKAA
jgi:hypothetical protein